MPEHLFNCGDTRVSEGNDASNQHYTHYSVEDGKYQWWTSEGKLEWTGKHSDQGEELLGPKTLELIEQLTAELSAAVGTLKGFINTVAATGGLDENDNPVGDPEWVDLGDAYVEACSRVRALPLRQPAEETEDEFEWINRTYQLNVRKGTRVVYDGWEDPRKGTVVGADNGYLKVALDGDDLPGRYHPTWQLKIIEEKADA